MQRIISRIMLLFPLAAPRPGRLLLRRGVHAGGGQADPGERGLPRLREPDAVQGILVYQPQLHNQVKKRPRGRTDGMIAVIRENMKFVLSSLAKPL